MNGQTQFERDEDEAYARNFAMDRKAEEINARVRGLGPGYDGHPDRAMGVGEPDRGTRRVFLTPEMATDYLTQPVISQWREIARQRFEEARGYWDIAAEVGEYDL